MWTHVESFMFFIINDRATKFAYYKGNKIQSLHMIDFVDILTETFSF